MISTTRSTLKHKGSSTSLKYSELETVRRVATIRAKGTRFVNGITDQYQAKMPKQLEGMVDKQKYQQYMNHLNHKIKQYWPCCFAYYCGYCCLPVTLGLSLFIPKLCIDEAEAVLTREISKINQDVLGNGKLQMRLIKKCYDSQLIIEEKDFAGFQLNSQNNF